MNWRLHILVLWCIIFSAINVEVYGQCDITISDENPCSGSEVSIGVDDAEDKADYSWDLDDDGEVDLRGSVFFDYSFPETFVDRTYTITLYKDGSVCNSIDVPVKAGPDPTIGVPQGSVTLEGNELKACGAMGTITLELFNASATIANNVSYMISWGDGSAPETFDNSTFTANSTISHTYTSFGYFPIFVTVEHENGCRYSRNYVLYNGGNPSVGLANPGNTVGLCAPATLTFPITNTAGNPPGTVYTIFVNGQKVAQYSQQNLPPSFTYTFDKPSCGINTSTGNYPNAFDLKIVASNPCNSSAATIEPIEVSTPPSPTFEIKPPEYDCTGAVYGLSNTSSNVNEVRSGSPSQCLDILSPNWTISGTAGQDWEIVSGNLFNANNVDVRFLKPGTYTIEMTIVSFACGEFTFTQEVTIDEQPEISGSAQILDVGVGPNGENCSPYKYEFISTAVGEVESYLWEVESDQDWDFIDGSTSDSPNANLIFYGGGEYRVKLSAANACNTIEWDTLITLVGRPTAVLDIPNYCDQATINFDNSIVQYGDNGYNIDSYDWAFEGAQTTSSTAPNPSNIQYNQPGEYVVRLRTSNTCGSVTIRDTFLIQAQDDLNLPPDRSTCKSDAPFTLDAGLAGGVWSGPGVSGEGQFDPADAQDGLNTLTYTFGSGVCVLEGQMNITVNPLPAIDLGDDQALCTSNNNVRLTASPEGGTWNSLDGAVLDGDLFVVKQTPPGEYRVSYQYVDANGCAAEDVLNIDVLDGPTVTANDTTYCNSARNQRLPSASIIGGTWTGVGVLDEEIFNPFAAGGAGTYTLRYFYTDPQSQCTTQVPITVSVVDPVKVDAGDDLVVCEATEVLLLDSIATPPGGFWYFGGQRMDEAIFDPNQAANGTYKFAYEVGNGVCILTDTLEIRIDDQEEFDLGPNEEVCANGEEIRLSGTGGLNGLWSGTGIVDSLNGFFDPSGLAPGDYEVLFTRQDANLACPGADTKIVRVRPQPQPAFVIPGSVCIATEFSPANESVGATNFVWDFGDGAGSTNTNVTHRYNAFGTYVVSLEAGNNFGCSAVFLDTIEVAPAPEASFALPVDEGCAPLTIDFENTTSGSGITYEWDFGNGQTSNRAVPVDPVIYQTSRRDTSYVISLRTSNGCGSTVYRDTVQVYPFPLANFGFSVDTGCAPVNVMFANISQGSPDAFFWDFGNGITSTNASPTPQVYNAGTSPITYNIKLRVSNACGVDSLSKPLVVFPEEVQAFFNLNNDRGCAPYTVQLDNYSTPAPYINWDFGDGQTAGGNLSSHTYTEPGEYTIKLNVGNGCKEDSITATVRVLDSPDLDFAYSPNLCTGQEILFRNNSGPLANLRWDFGTGATSNQGNVTYTYPSTGTYTVSLSGGIASTGCADTLTKTITIVEPPQAQIQGIDLEGCAPYPARFSSSGSIGDFYRWNFGDGNTSTDAEPVHEYVDPGTYTVELTVSNIQGCEADTVISGVTIFPSPTADFIVPEQVCGLPTSLTPANLSTGADDYQWTLSNGTRSELRSPTINITEGTDLSVELISANQFGCADSITRLVRIRDQALADFTLDPGNGCDPLPVVFTNYSRGNQYRWDFGDGSTSTDRQPTHIYRRPGTYDVRLHVSFDGLCADSLSLGGQVTVLPGPLADFDWVPVTQNGQTTRQINFVNQSQNAISYFWDFGDGTTTTEENPSHEYEVSQSWQVLLEVANELGCTDDTMLVVQPSFIARLYVPNAFAPDQGVGDATVFLPKGVGIREYQLQIFSPYGELLWESTELADGQPAEGWDGTHNGHPLPQDVYVWKIRAIFDDGTFWTGAKTESGSYTRLGSVTLIR